MLFGADGVLWFLGNRRVMDSPQDAVAVVDFVVEIVFVQA